MRLNFRSVSIATAAALACVGACLAAEPHAHGEPRSPAVQAALREAIARLPPPDYAALTETRRAAPGKADAGSMVSLDGAIGMSVVVVLDETGAPHAECVETAPPPVRDPKQ
jgi:hypothetical protein